MNTLHSLAFCTGLLFASAPLCEESSGYLTPDSAALRVAVAPLSTAQALPTVSPAGLSVQSGWRRYVDIKVVSHPGPGVNYTLHATNKTSRGIYVDLLIESGTKRWRKEYYLPPKKKNKHIGYYDFSPTIWVKGWRFR